MAEVPLPGPEELEPAQTGAHLGHWQLTPVTHWKAQGFKTTRAASGSLSACTASSSPSLSQSRVLEQVHHMTK